MLERLLERSSPSDIAMVALAAANLSRIARFASKPIADLSGKPQIC
jgi:hypothetical protein